MKKIYQIVAVFWGLVIVIAYTFAASKGMQKIIDLNVKNTSLETVIKLIAFHAGKNIQFDKPLTQKVSYAIKGKTVQEILNIVTSDHNLENDVSSKTIYISEYSNDSNSSSDFTEGFGKVKLIQLKYAKATTLISNLVKYLEQGEELFEDANFNSMVFRGSQRTYNRIMEFVRVLDRMPKQILIEAKIVEATKNFSRELGVNLGNLANPSLENSVRIGAVLNPSAVPSDPTLGYRYRIKRGAEGNYDDFDAKLLASESKGDAKVISRPKIVTLNNQEAVINSGLVFNVKTLTTNSTTDVDGNSSGVAGGLTSVEAGLELRVLPTIVDKDSVKLIVNVNNSEPDLSNSVDGIPGVANNSANTSVIVKSNSTVVIAGLIKKATSEGDTGVPVLKDIPVLGLLFKTKTESKRRNELIIFIKPKILDKPYQLNAHNNKGKKTKK